MSIGSSAHQRQDISCPDPAAGHDQYHCRYHVRSGEHLDLDHAEAGCQKQHAAAGLEIVDHVRCGQRVDDACQKEQDHENDQLRDRNKGNNESQNAGKDHGCEKVEDRFGDQNRLITGHAGENGSVDPGAARAEKNDDGDQSITKFLLGDVGFLLRKDPAYDLLHLDRTFRDPFPEMKNESDRGADDDRKNDSRHIYHKRDRGDPHRHGTDTEDHVQIFFEADTHLMSGKRSEQTSQCNGRHIDQNSCRHIQILSIKTVGG